MRAQAVHMTTTKLNRKISAQIKSTKDFIFFNVQSRRGTLLLCKKLSLGMHELKRLKNVGSMSYLLEES